jgi:ABC-2 type transport system ATP-binding protein
VTGAARPERRRQDHRDAAIVGVQGSVRGRVDVLGEPAGSPGLRARVGYVTQTPAVYADLSVRANLDYFAAILGSTRVEQVLPRRRPWPAPAPAGRTLSGGQRAGSPGRRAARRAELLVLDEPTVGPRPGAAPRPVAAVRGAGAPARRCWSAATSWTRPSRCDRLLLLRDGQLVADDTLDGVLGRTGHSDRRAGLPHPRLEGVLA